MSTVAPPAASLPPVAFPRLRRQLRMHQLVVGACTLFGVVLAVVLLLALIDHRWELSRPARIGTAVVALAALAVGVWRTLIEPLGVRLADLDIAALLDPSGRAAASVATQQQFSGSESELAKRAMERSRQRLAESELDERLDRGPFAKWLAGLVGLLLVPIVLAVAMPQLAGVFAGRWFAFSDTPWPRDVSIEVPSLVDGKLLVPRGEPHTLEALVTSKRGDELPLRLTLDADGTTRRLVFDRLSESRNQAQLPPLATAGSFTLRAGDGRLGPITIEPIDRPVVTDLSVTGKHPKQAEATTFRIAAGEPMAQYLADSEVELTVQSNVPASLAVEPSELVQLDPVDETTTRVRYRHTEPTTLQLALTGSRSGLRSLPSAVTVGLQMDRPPRVSIRHSKVRLRITPQAIVPLRVEASDDFGLTGLTLLPKPQRFQTVEAVSGEGSDEGPQGDEPEAALDDSPTDAPAETLPSPDKMTQRTLALPETSPVLDAAADETIDLAEFAFRPGDLVRVSAAATDNAFAGQQLRKSRTVTFRVVKKDELFREILLRLQQVRARLRRATDSAEQMTAKIEVAENDAELSREFQANRREIAAVSSALAASLEEMRYNRLGGDQSWRRIELTITEPLAELLAGRIETQRLAVAGLAKGESDRDETASRQQEIVASLQQILKNMSQWDSFADVFNELDAILSIEKTVNKRTEQLRGDSLGDVFDEDQIDSAGIFDDLGDSPDEAMSEPPESDAKPD